LVALVLLVVLLSSCQTTSTGGTEVACQAFEPITYSSRDTAETRRQIVGHNAAFDALCP